MEDKKEFTKDDYEALTKAGLMNFVQHPEMKKLFILDRTWYPLVTESMIYTIRDQFTKSYDSDKKAILEGRMRGGNVDSRTDEILTRIYDKAIVVINEMHDDYARCIIILNSEMNLEYNNGLVAMRIFLVHREDNHTVTANIIRPKDQILVKEPVGSNNENI